MCGTSVFRSQKTRFCDCVLLKELKELHSASEGFQWLRKHNQGDGKASEVISKLQMRMLRRFLLVRMQDSEPERDLLLGPLKEDLSTHTPKICVLLVAKYLSLLRACNLPQQQSPWHESARSSYYQTLQAQLPYSLAPSHVSIQRFFFAASIFPPSPHSMSRPHQ
jgi:hypothetical protein